MNAKEVIATIRRAIQSVKDKGDSALSIDAFETYLSGLEEQVDSQTPRELTQAESAQYAAENSRYLAGYRAEVDTELAMFQSVIDAGQGALKWAIYINGGAAAGLLAFLGNIWGNPRNFEFAWLLARALIYFLGGVLAGSVACGTTYLSQLFHAQKLKPWGDIINIVSILLVISSYFAYGYGGWTAFMAIRGAFIPISEV